MRIPWRALRQSVPSTSCHKTFITRFNNENHSGIKIQEYLVSILREVSKPFGTVVPERWILKPRETLKSLVSKFSDVGTWVGECLWRVKKTLEPQIIAQLWLDLPLSASERSSFSKSHFLSPVVNRPCAYQSISSSFLWIISGTKPRRPETKGRCQSKKERLVPSVYWRGLYLSLVEKQPIRRTPLF